MEKELKSGGGKHKNLGMIVDFLEKESGEGDKKWRRKTQMSGGGQGHLVSPSQPHP